MNPPPASRSRVVLNLKQPIKLFQMQHQEELTLVTIRSFLTETMHAHPSMFVSTITTDLLRDVEDSKYQELQVNFYSTSGTGANTRMIGEEATKEEPTSTTKLSFFVIMPCTWKPRTYMAALNLSLKKYAVLSVESVQINGRSYLTINDVNNYFVRYKTLHKKLIHSASFMNVRGGGRYGGQFE
jgi:hypothetical protein